MEKQQRQNLWKVQSGLIPKGLTPEKCEELNKAVHKWFLILRSEKVPISRPMLKEKALKFVGGLNIEGFQASEGWLEFQAKMEDSDSFQPLF